MSEQILSNISINLKGIYFGIFLYITHVHFYKEKYVDANLDASDNVISGNEPSSEMLRSQSQIPEWAKTGNAKEWRPK